MRSLRRALCSCQMKQLNRIRSILAIAGSTYCLSYIIGANTRLQATRPSRSLRSRFGRRLNRHGRRLSGTIQDPLTIGERDRP